MSIDGLVGKIESRYTMQDVQDEKVETVSVVALDQLEAALSSAVEEQVSALKLELQQAKEQLANIEDGGDSDGGGGLDEAAVEAALEAEAKAIERAQEAEAKVGELRSKVAELEEAASSAGDTSELEGQIAELQGKVEAAEAATKAEAEKAAGLTEKVAALEADLAKAKEAAADDVDAGGEVTDDDKRQARRVAMAFLEDVFSDDEDKTNKAIKDGKLHEVFAKEIKLAQRKYIKRIKAHVRAAEDFWGAALTECEKTDW